MSTTSTESYFFRILFWRKKYNFDHSINKWRLLIILISIHNHECSSISLLIFFSTTRHSTRFRRWNLKWNLFLYIKFLFKCFLLMLIDFIEFLKAKIIYYFFSTTQIRFKRRIFLMIIEFSSNQDKTRHEKMKYILKIQNESREYRVKFFVEREFVIVFFLDD
jgi:hypothetical protein